MFSEDELVACVRENAAWFSNYAFGLTNDREDAKDVVQNALMRAWRFRDTYDSSYGCKLRTWIFRIIHNEAVTLLRKRNKKLAYSIFREFTDPDACVLDVPDIPPDDTLKVNSIIEFMKLVKPKHRRPLQLYIDGYSYGEIADMLNIPVGSVKSKINRGRIELKNLAQELL